MDHVLQHVVKVLLVTNQVVVIFVLPEWSAAASTLLASLAVKDFHKKISGSCWAPERPNDNVPGR